MNALLTDVMSLLAWALKFIDQNCEIDMQQRTAMTCRGLYRLSATSQRVYLEKVVRNVVSTIGNPPHGNGRATKQPDAPG